MITRINADNSTKYMALFQKAENLLKAGIDQNLLPDIGTDNPSEIQIVTLNQYYAYLQDLIALANDERLESNDFNPSADLARYFTRLPLDEDFLEINADTRVIKIPTNFARYGVGVQGDETAEVIYFTIDRYFDSIDLAGENINIVIQWEARNANKEIITGYSPNYGKDITTLPGKIIFGWPIYREFTEAAGTLRFAVRFFSVGRNSSNEDELKYSLSTLPAELTINATINYDLLDNTLREVDRGQIITSRITNSGLNDPSVPTPGMPIISTPMYVRSAGEFISIVDLPSDSNEHLELAISAKPRDFGAIIYRWRKWPYDSNTGYYRGPSETLTDVQNGVYEEVTSNIPEEAGQRDIYYIDDAPAGSDTPNWTIVDVDTFLSSLEYEEGEEGEEGGFRDSAGTSLVKLYKKLSVATISEVGLYTVDVSAKYKTNGSTVVMADVLDEAIDVGIKVPGPLKPIITPPEPVEGSISVTADGVTHVIVKNGTATLQPQVREGETGQPADEVGDEPHVDLAYQWNTINGEGVATPIAGATNASLVLEDLATSGLDNVYRLDVTATRNGVDTTEGSGNYRLTNEPVKPTIKVRTYKQGSFVWEEADYNTTESQPIPLSRRAGGQFNKINLTVDPIALTDKVSYVWMKAVIDDENDYEHGTLQLHAELDNKLPDLFADNPAEASDEPVSEPFGLTDLPPELGDVIAYDSLAEEGNIPTFQFDDNTGEGYYYCIIINELNNNRIYNISPFFHVS